MGTPAEEWIEEGKQRGKAEGKAEGMAEGRAEAVLRILRGRFGEPDARLAERIRSADLDVLDAMLDLALTVEKPDDVIRGAGQH
jgi:predicted transposase YdaD